MLGLTHLNGAVWKNYTGDISGFGSIYKNPSNNFYAVDYNTVNYNDFLFGLAFVMPYGQVEAGYNRLFRQPFVNVGLNVPIKNMVNVFRF